jgi:hypothetical protein
MYSRTAADRRKRGRSLEAGGGASVGSGLLAGNGFACSIICPMDSSAFVAAHSGFQLRAGKSSSYPTATGACL